MAEELKLTMLDNGIDFIVTGVSSFFMDDTPDATAHKYAVLHLFSGTLLILKERLRRADASQIWVDPGQDPATNPKTVSFDMLMKRLKQHAKVEFDDATWKLLRGAQQLRNKIEHFDVKLNLEDTQSIVGELTEFIDAFMKHHLQLDLQHRVPEKVWTRLAQLTQIAKRRHEEWLRDWEERAAKYTVLDTIGLADLLAKSSYHPTLNPDGQDAEACIVCDDYADIAFAEEDIGICTNPACKNTYVTSRCMRCGKRIVYEAGLCGICSDYVHQENT